MGIKRSGVQGSVLTGGSLSMQGRTAYQTAAVWSLAKSYKVFFKSELDTETRKRTRATVDIFCQEYIHLLGSAGVYTPPQVFLLSSPETENKIFPPGQRALGCFALCSESCPLCISAILYPPWFPDPTQIINDSGLVLCLPPL